MAETLVFASLFAPTRMKEKPCQFSQAEDVGLNLYLTLGSIDYDPWIIKKNLSVSDLGELSRLLLPKNLIKEHILPFMSKSVVERVHSSSGESVTVFDNDRRTKHTLVFKYWQLAKSYVLQSKWTKEFVNVRRLKEDDLIGIYWDANSSAFASSTSSSEYRYCITAVNQILEEN